MSHPENEVDDDEEIDIFEELEQMNQRVTKVDRTLFYGLRGLVMLIDYLERAINPLSEPEEKAAALIKVREIIDSMRESMK